jgi:hypothetical protein
MTNDFPSSFSTQDTIFKYRVTDVSDSFMQVPLEAKTMRCLALRSNARLLQHSFGRRLLSASGNVKIWNVYLSGTF